MIFLLGCISSVIISLFLFALFRRHNLFKTQKSFFLSFFVSVLIGATTLLYFSAHKFDYYSQLKKWPVTSGIVVATKIVGDRAVMPQLYYQYSISGKQFTDSSDLATPAFGNKKFRDQTARNVLKDFNQGDTIRVYYNPENMAESVLKINPSWSSYMRYGLAIILQTISIFLLLSGIFSNKTR
jgi:hypothetical protein